MTRKEHAEDVVESLPHVVIVGGGFGGLCAALALSRRAVRVTLVDRNNYHLFQPLLYQVATASLSAGDIASPIRSILRVRAGRQGKDRDSQCPVDCGSCGFSVSECFRRSLSARQGANGN